LIIEPFIYQREMLEADFEIAECPKGQTKKFEKQSLQVLEWPNLQRNFLQD
jgi:hypothetical protein